MFEKARWIWCKEQRPNTYCCVRGHLEIPAVPLHGVIRIIADSRYRFHVNGTYVGQGPTPFKPPYLYVDSYDITAHLRTGHNVIAVLGNFHGVKHCTYTPGTPGVIAEIEVTDVDGKVTRLATGSDWKVHHLDAYRREVPRRTWATPWCEYYDARLEPAGWKTPAFDDSTWPTATEMKPGAFTFLPRVVAPLEEYRVNPSTWVGVWSTATGVPLEPNRKGVQPPGLSELMDREKLKRLRVPTTPAGDPLAIKAGKRGTAFAVDLRKEIAGHLEIDVECPEGTVIDLCPTESLKNGRPWCFRKHGEYSRRYIARAGRQTWRCFGYDGIRYLHAVVRGPHGNVVFHRLGAWLRQSSLPIRATFECNDPAINRIWEITCHSVRVGSQEVHVDCPTREQTSAWGDHIWSGLWAGYMTGDFSALRHLVISIEQVQMRDGQLPCYAFASDHDMSPVHEQLPLYDYSLIAVWGVWIYLLATGDRDLAARVVPACDRVLDWYRKQVGPTGLVELDGDAMWKKLHGQLFIDHPGLGCHNAPYPGLDRRGINTPLNCFFIQALDAQANVLGQLGQNKRARSLKLEAERVRTAAGTLFYRPAEGAYADGYFEGKPLERISQQANSLAVISGVCPPDWAPLVLDRVLHPRDRRLCRCATYFWTYLADALCMSGMHSRMLKEVVQLWNEMAEKGATAWWETFLGDELDSLCHIWSCVPGYLLLAEILGIKPAEPGFSRVVVSPRFDLVRRAAGSVSLPRQTVSVHWEPVSARKVSLVLKLDGPADGILQLPPGWMAEKDRVRSLPLYADRTTHIVALASGMKRQLFGRSRLGLRPRPTLLSNNSWA